MRRGFILPNHSVAWSALAGLGYLARDEIRHRATLGRMATEDLIRGTDYQEGWTCMLDAGVVFIHIPKTAGLSVSASLFGGIGPGHRTARFVRSAIGVRRYSTSFKFTFVRDPIDRLQSAFTFLKNGGLTQADREWAEANLAGYSDILSLIIDGLDKPAINRQIHFRPQTDFILDPAGNLLVDFVGRSERIEQDLQMVADRMGRPATLQRVNSSGAAHSLDMPEEALSRVRQLYARDYRFIDSYFVST